MSASSTETPFRLSRDFHRHEPVPVRFKKPDLSRHARVVQSRFVQSKGLFIEVTPPLLQYQPFRVGEDVKFAIRLPHQTELVGLQGEVTRIYEHAISAEGKEISLLAIRLDNVGIEEERKLKAHEIAVDDRYGNKRSLRISARFEVDPLDMDTISALTVCDLSMSGMFINAKAKFSIGKKIRIGFRLPFQKERVQLSGKVIWVGEKALPGANQKIRGFGFEYTEIPPETRSALATYYSRFDI